jgi:DNA-binding response OmpR family regulator
MKKVLVVDDDIDILDALQLTMEYAGYEVIAVSRGDKVIPMVRECQPDLILLDVLLSGADGRKIARELKSTEYARDIPLILVSAHPSASVSAAAWGADAFLAKPFDLDQLIEMVQSLIRS